MCGRFTQMYSWEEVHAFLSLFGAPQNLEPRYNLAPTQRAAVVRHDDRGRRGLSMLRWGLIPIWATDHKIDSQCISARAETGAIKPALGQPSRRVAASCQADTANRSGKRRLASRTT